MGYSTNLRPDQWDPYWGAQSTGPDSFLGGLGWELGKTGQQVQREYGFDPNATVGAQSNWAAQQRAVAAAHAAWTQRVAAAPYTRSAAAKLHPVGEQAVAQQQEFAAQGRKPPAPVAAPNAMFSPAAVAAQAAPTAPPAAQAPAPGLAGVQRYGGASGARQYGLGTRAGGFAGVRSY